MRTKTVTLCMLFALSCALLWCADSAQCQRTAAGEMIRLRVVAESDKREDQELKLLVRDAVLEASGQLLRGDETREEARRVLEEHLCEVGDAALAVLRREGQPDEVRAYLTYECAGTRRYGAFTLPAGEWLTLRVDIGEAAGHNWWCVVFPPICTAASEEVIEETMSAETAELICGGEERYELRFRTLELLESLKEWLNDKCYHFVITDS